MDDELDLQTADEVLESAWPRERRRARRRLVLAALGRAAIFMAALGALSLVVDLLFGMVVPWTFFVFMGALTLVAARPEPDERALLRRGGEAAPPLRSDATGER
jgi:hypothetical protein